MDLVSNMRMYGVNTHVVGLWKELTRWISAQSGVPMSYVEHPAPAPIDDLWDRSDLGLVQMCGWPFWQRIPSATIIAAPVIDDDFTENKAVYWSELVVRSDSDFERLEDTFGGKIAWTVENSHSGCNAPRHLLLPYFVENGAPLYTESVGPVITPRGSIEAVLSGKADVAPVDSYFHLLLQRHEPETLAKLKTIARTERAPIPLLVGAPDMDPSKAARIQETLVNARMFPEAADLLDQLAIRKFIVPSRKDYAMAQLWHEEAVSKNYILPS